jgi:hypothetical protein
VWLFSNWIADRQGNWRRENLCYATELRNCVLILDSIPSSIQQDLIVREEVLYGFVIIIIIIISSSSKRVNVLDYYVGDPNL